MLILSQNRGAILDFTGGLIETDKGTITLNNNVFAGSIAKYWSSTRAEQVLVDIIKKAEVGCNTYIMPEE